MTTTSLYLLPMITPKTLQLIQRATKTKPALLHSLALATQVCCCSAAPAAFLFILLEVVLGEIFQEKTGILLPLTHGIYIPEQHCSVVHY